MPHVATGEYYDSRWLDTRPGQDLVGQTPVSKRMQGAAVMRTVEELPDPRIALLCHASRMLQDSAECPTCCALSSARKIRSCGRSAVWCCTSKVVEPIVATTAAMATIRAGKTWNICRAPGSLRDAPHCRYDAHSCVKPLRLAAQSPGMHQICSASNSPRPTPGHNLHPSYNLVSPKPSDRPKVIRKESIWRLHSAGLTWKLKSGP